MKWPPSQPSFCWIPFGIRFTVAGGFVLLDGCYLWAKNCLVVHLGKPWLGFIPPLLPSLTYIFKRHRPSSGASILVKWDTMCLFEIRCFKIPNTHGYVAHGSFYSRARCTNNSCQVGVGLCIRAAFLQYSKLFLCTFHFCSALLTIPAN